MDLIEVLKLLAIRLFKESCCFSKPKADDLHTQTFSIITISGNKSDMANQFERTIADVATKKFRNHTLAEPFHQCLCHVCA